MEARYVKDLLNRINILLKERNIERAKRVARNAKRVIENNIEKDSRFYIDTMDSLLDFYIEIGELSSAEEILKLLIKQKENNLSKKENQSYGQRLNQLSVIYYKAGKYKEAEEILNKALKIFDKSVGKNSSDYSKALWDIGNVYNYTHRYKEALGALNKSLKIYTRIRNDKGVGYADRLNDLALVYGEIDEYREAEGLLIKALDLYKSLLGEESREYTSSLSNLSDIYFETGRYKEAEEIRNKNLEIYRKLYGVETLPYAEALHKLAISYYESGKYNKAEESIISCIKIKEKILGNNDVDYASSINELAIIYDNMGRYEEAEDLLLKALEIYERTTNKNTISYARCMGNLANLYVGTYRYEEAHGLFKKSLDIYQSISGVFSGGAIRTLHNLGIMYYSINAYKEAEEIYLKISEIRKEIYGEENTEYAKGLMNLAAIYFDMERYRESKDMVLKCLNIYKNDLGKENLVYASSLNNLSRIYERLEESEEAERLLKESLKIYKEKLGEEHPKYLSTLNNLAFLYLNIDEKEKSLELADEIIQRESKNILKLLRILPEKIRLMYLNDIRQRLDLYLSLILLKGRPSHDLVNTAFNNILWRKGLNTEVMMKERERALQDKYQDLRPILKELEAIKISIGNKIFTGPAKNQSLEEHLEIINNLTKEKNKLELQISKKIPEMEMEKQLNEVEISKLFKYIGKETLYVDFVKYYQYTGSKNRGGERYSVFILTMESEADYSIKLLDIGEAEYIDNLINKYRTAIIEDDEEVVSLGARLYNLVFSPILEFSKGRTNIIISPDGELSKIPFEILPSKKGYLIDEFPISYVNAGRDLLRRKRNPNNKIGDPIIIADPIYDIGDKSLDNNNKKDKGFTRGHRLNLSKRDDLNLCRLPFTKIEGELIGSRFGQSVIMHDKVLESRIKKIKSPKLIHIATHGFFLEDKDRNSNRDNRGFVGMDWSTPEDRQNRITKLKNPLLRSGLALTGAKTWLEGGSLPKEAEDGLLTAEDVTTLDLTGTELVVLSACETGLGEVRTGEGVYGLRRAFVLAGAKTLIMSLWAVDDLATLILMDRFYENIIEGKSNYGEALREAQRYLRRLTVGNMREKWLTKEMEEKVPEAYKELLEDLRIQSNDFKPFEDPYYWGGFICQGTNL